jgi:D-alanyl-lipoteichoic acid acyltransferase DltB (MBOAT superfamily)
LDFLSWGTFLAAIAIGGMAVSIPTIHRHKLFFFMNLLMGFAFLGYSFIPLLFVGLLLFPFLKHLRGPHGSKLVYPLCLLSIAPLIALRSEIDLSWRGVWLSASLAFFCLQNCGAVFEIFWGKADAPKSVLHWMSFSAFFPSLVAGPVGRWSALGPQLESPRSFHAEDGREYIFLLAQGIFKKIVFAAPLYFVIDRFFAAPKEFGLIAALVVSFLFRYAVWADISAHTDWAQGIARILGIRLCSNFDNPFHTARLADFWRRWHSSLSRWLQDFVFMPIAFGPLRRLIPANIAMVVALLIAFICLGLWHGLAAGFLVMGLYKGVGVLVAEWLWKSLDRKHIAFQIIKIFSGAAMMVVFMVFPTLLIRMSLDDAIHIFTSSDLFWPTSWLKLTAAYDAEDLTHKVLWPTFAIAVAFECLQHVSKMKKNQGIVETSEPCSLVSPFSTWTQVAIISTAIVIFFVFGSFSTWLGFSYVNH